MTTYLSSHDQNDEITHFFYPYISDVENSWSLELSIKSIHKFYKSPYDITVIGDDPNITGIKYIHFQQSTQYSAQSNTNNLRIKMAETVDSFVEIHDDMCFVKNTNVADIKQVRFNNVIPMNIVDLIDFNIQSIFIRRVIWGMFASSSSEYFNFATHTPCHYISSKVLEIEKLFNISQNRKADDFHIFIFENLYYNHFSFECIEIDSFRAGYWGDFDDVELTEQTHIVNYNDAGLRKYDVKKMLSDIIE